MVKIGKLFKKGDQPSTYAKLASKARAASPAFGKTEKSSPASAGLEARDEPVAAPESNGPSERESIEEMPSVGESMEEESIGESASQSEAESQSDEEQGTVQTYDDDLSQGSTAVSQDDDYTFEDPTGGDHSTVLSKKSVGTAKGSDSIGKKYFHKDVVLNSLDDGANNLVIRAMYFIPKPKDEDHVVVKVEVS